jgi:hypothetical protein
MEVNDLLHAPIALSSGKDVSVSIAVEARVCARASLDVVRMENEKTLLSVLM